MSGRRYRLILFHEYNYAFSPSLIIIVKMRGRKGFKVENVGMTIFENSADSTAWWSTGWCVCGGGAVFVSYEYIALAGLLIPGGDINTAKCCCNGSVPSEEKT